jgi:death-on-curing protein
MTGPIQFLTVDDVLQIHHRMIAEFGGTAEVRDHGLLHSACAMPQARFGGQYLHNGLPAMAAAYLFHLCANHPFVDGNKRTALASAEMFILINDHELRATNAVLEALTLAVAAGTQSKDDVITFTDHHVV